MSIQNKNKKKQNSAQKVADFLEKNKLHKKDFAQMVGVTLSYVYNLIDETIPFSSRITTLERIATVMDVLPEEFEEYLIQEEPRPYDENLEIIKEKIRQNKIKTVDFLKMFERKRRLSLVDVLRGAENIPIDYKELSFILSALNMNDNEIFELWEKVFGKSLEKQGFNTEKNKDLIKEMLDGAKKYLKNKK